MNEYDNLQEKKAHSDPFFPYNTYLCSIPLDFFRVAPHWHDDTEIIVIKKGRGLISVDTCSYEVEQGNIILVRAGQVHSIFQKNNDIMEYENIIFNNEILFSQTCDPCTREYFLQFMDIKHELPTLINLKTQYYDEMFSEISEIDLICDQKEKFYQLAIKSHLYLFFYYLFKGQNILVKIDTNKKLSKIKGLINFVEKNFSQHITVKQVAQELGFSTSHFMKWFKDNMHTTFTNYLNDYRLQKSAEFLRTENDNIIEIAEKSGFNNLSYFNRLFKNYFKMTPREYRNKFTF